MRNAHDSCCISTVSQPDCAKAVSTHAVGQQHADSMTQPAAKRKTRFARAGLPRPQLQLLRRDPMRGRRARGVQWRSQSKELLISRPFVLRQISAMGERSHVAATRQHRRTLSRGTLLAPHRRVRAAATWQPRAGRSHAAHVADGSDARGRRAEGGGRRRTGVALMKLSVLVLRPGYRRHGLDPPDLQPWRQRERARTQQQQQPPPVRKRWKGNKARRVRAEPQP